MCLSVGPVQYDVNEVTISRLSGLGSATRSD